MEESDEYTGPILGKGLLNMTIPDTPKSKE
jgi:hypothetical protein